MCKFFPQFFSKFRDGFYDIVALLRKILIPLLLISGIVFILFFYIKEYELRRDYRLCYVDQMFSLQYGDNDVLWNRIEEIDRGYIQPRPGKDIFFHDARIHQFPLVRKYTYLANLYPLSAHDACTIESAALHNPDRNVFVLFASPLYLRVGEEGELMRALFSYPNVHLRNVNLWAYAADSPLYEWFLHGDIFKSSHLTTHVSHMMRYLTLWHYGGITLDPNVLVLRSLQDLPPNFMAGTLDYEVSTSILALSNDTQGHSIAATCLNHLQIDFDGHQHHNSGKFLLESVLDTMCNGAHDNTSNDNTPTVNNTNCKSLKLFEPEFFAPLLTPRASYFLLPELREKLLAKIKHAYVVELWNRQLEHRDTRTNALSAYAALALEHCPKVFATLKDRF